MASPFATMATYFDAEWRVNGFWNSIFSHCFPPMLNTTGYICCPEALAGIAQTQGGKADLVIRRLDHLANGNWQISRPLVVFEGKGQNTVADWETIVGQIRMWCDNSGVLNVWAIAAWENRVRFYYYDNTGMHPATWGAPGIVWGTTYSYNVKVMAELTAISNILQYAQANP